MIYTLQKHVRLYNKVLGRIIPHLYKCFKVYNHKTKGQKNLLHQSHWPIILWVVYTAPFSCFHRRQISQVMVRCSL